MLRREFLAASSMALAARAWGAGTTTLRRNVLFIASDDLRPQLGCYGHSRIKSPNIDKLASQGLRFDRAYCQQAVCAPTRASLLTGTRPDTTRVYDLQTPLDTVRPDLVSIPHHFRTHGYETISLGKIYHHDNEDPQGWSAPPWRVRGSQGDDYWRYRDPLSLIGVRQNNAVLRAAYERNLKAGKKVEPPRYGRGPAFEGPDVPDNA
ncbi:MAG: sulfatase-like hydrolase/transferase, partial [Acidobacteria bacterium]|nr:sulfatase-like hydrolase/transferase [Acidobacteriota bacterium]